MNLVTRAAWGARPPRNQQDVAELNARVEKLEQGKR